MTQTLSQLENRDAFIERHIGPDAQQQQEMLKTVGADSLNALIGQIVPQDIQLATPPQVGDATTEFAALAELKAIASRNKRFKSYIGMGYTAVQLPPVIQRNMLENPGWYTAYTPYQPEVSQGRLEALLNFQQVTLDLTGLDIASASLLDEATAAAEAMAMAKRVSKLKNANRFFVAADVHPQTLDVVRTRAETFGFDVIVDDADKVLDHQDVFGVLLQQVGTTGEVHDYGALIAELKTRKVVVSVAADFMALVLLTAPGKQGADIVFGSAQRFGVPMGYGGPHAAFFGAKDEFKRSMPGRIIGVSKDAAGNTALRMAMQTREQHIRREKATSNICTNSGLCCLAFTIHMSLLGETGLRKLALLNHEKAVATRDALARLENMVGMANVNLTPRATRQQICSAVTVVMQVSRLTDGARKLVSLQEVTGMEGDIIAMHEIFRFEQTGVDAEGKVLGHFCATGVRPRFTERLRMFGAPVPDSVFDPDRIYE